MPVRQLPQPPKVGSARFNDWMWRLWKTVLATNESGPRNRVIGGDFTTNPFQAGSSFAAAATGTYVADMFRIDFSTAGVVTVTQTADAPTAAEAGVYSTKCLHIDCTTAESSIVAGDYFILSTNIEGLNIATLGFGQSGERYVTLSFWVKTTKTGTYCVALRNSASNRSQVREYTVNASDTWEFKEVSFPVDTSGTWLYDTGIGLRVSWCLLSGSTYQTTKNEWAAGDYVATSGQVNALDSTSNNFKIQLVSLEAGQSASPFEYMSAQSVLGACCRYYQKSYSAGVAVPTNSSLPGLCYAVALFTQSGAASSERGAKIEFPHHMRIAPNITVYSYTNSTSGSWEDGGGTAKTMNASSISTSGFLISNNATVATNTTLFGHWVADARI